MKDWVKETVESIKKMLAGYEKTSPEAKMMLEVKGRFETMQYAFNAALEDARKNAAINKFEDKLKALSHIR